MPNRRYSRHNNPSRLASAERAGEATRKAGIRELAVTLAAAIREVVIREPAAIQVAAATLEVAATLEATPAVVAWEMRGQG